MARLNEPAMSAESIETLRRKLLRQNRELARINSSQSLRIRHLENECARMLSENLELRSHILQLEREIECSKASRIADHALEIKAKLESQLLEWGELLSGLGVEPPTKRHSSPRTRKIAQSRLSGGRRSSVQRPLRDLAKESEARARDEGRLTPIQEHRSYPRMSMDQEQIMALRADAEEDVTTSPDLGPPPMSRFVESQETVDTSPSKEAPKPVVAEAPASKTEAQVQPQNFDQVKCDLSSQPTQPTPEAKQVDTIIAQPAKAGSKRKYGASDDAGGAATKAADSHSTRPIVKSTLARDRANGKSLKELATMRREAKEKSLVAPPTVPLASARKPLAAKSTNEHIVSPKKVGKTPGPEKDGPIRPRAKEAKDRPSKATPKPDDMPNKVITIPTIPPPPQQPNPIIEVPIPEEPTAAPQDLHLFSPASPEPSTARDESRDTPPPAHISSNGETSRPSRRARSAVSYAEPNLRDKMRRPTKDLVDAVSGEGKYRRSSVSTAEDISVVGGVKVKRESDASESWKRLPLLTGHASTSPDPAEAPLPASPLADKAPIGDALPSNVTIDRKKRRSSAVPRESSGRRQSALLVPQIPDESTLAPGDDSSAMSETTAETSVDVYEFTTSSPSATDKRESDNESSRGTSRRSRTSNAAQRNADADFEETHTTASRKRASINIVRQRGSDPDWGADEQVTTERTSLRDRSALRRKSTIV